ncbi:OPT-domain-containing protein [Suhomyces tanzawaensis NRRL Y-17324]|uniref:OPT-domain-containing protein n=1 Tax=Suhomyces tanzawaensis NRRL Y-17324 TaxID=984487 RepID=A0A1E4SIS7_9ASCO|nr:OPT-domain-containing protein [Suhomyces tanzawaensis NRRL Y-17324]ODV79404.1 OPT-domain-containing protein [Suhomyces tanzawaensis NRRL Y-17324]
MIVEEKNDINLESVDVGLGSGHKLEFSLTDDQINFILTRLDLEGLDSQMDLPRTAEVMIDRVDAMDESDAVKILEQAIIDHEGDVNLPTEVYDLLVALAQNPKSTSTDIYETPSLVTPDSKHYLTVSDWSLQVRLEAALIAYYSPYQEVRAVTTPYDDEEIPCETFRVYFLGLIWMAAGTFINEFFSQRQPRIILDPSVVQLFLLPCGRFLQYALPKWKFKVWRYTFDLNPGPWSHKEQMLATIFYTVSSTPNYAHFNIHIQRMKVYFDNEWATYGYQTLLLLCTNFMGFGFCGILRRFAVYPVQAMWPTLMPTLALNNALTQPEKRQNINGWTISRYRFFFIIFIFSFCYFWLPGYLFGALSNFNWITWIAPNNFNVATITGMVTGLGLNPIPSLDWNILDFNNALTIPLYSQANQCLGTLLGFFIITGMYYTNSYWSAYMPVNPVRIFNNKGVQYPVKRILNENNLFDQTKYEQVGPPYFTASGLVRYCTLFIMYPFAVIYEIGLNYRVIWRSFKDAASSIRHYHRSTYEGLNDPQSNLMKRYSEVPDAVFLVVLLISIILAIICVKIYPVDSPVWTIFFAIGINIVFLVPLITIAAATGYNFTHNVIIELLVGLAAPGNGSALNFTKALGFNIEAQAQQYISDQKMAHYVKIPPWAAFRCQMISVLVHSFVGLGVINFQIDSIKNYCEPRNKLRFTCPGVNRFFNATIQWGVIGPRKVFQVYPILPWCFLIGILLPIPCLLIKKYLPKRYVKYFQPTLIIGGIQIYTPFNISYYVGGLYLSIASMWYLRTRFPAFWSKYNYLFSGGMSAGVTFGAVIIYFSVQYHEKTLDWWGNTVSRAGLDGVGRSRLNATLHAPDGYFGLRKGHFP